MLNVTVSFTHRLIYTPCSMSPSLIYTPSHLQSHLHTVSFTDSFTHRARCHRPSFTHRLIYRLVYTPCSMSPSLIYTPCSMSPSSFTHRLNYRLIYIPSHLHTVSFTVSFTHRARCHRPSFTHRLNYRLVYTPCSMSPSLIYTQTLTAAGPQGIEDLVKQLVALGTQPKVCAYVCVCVFCPYIMG